MRHGQVRHGHDKVCVVFARPQIHIVIAQVDVPIAAGHSQHDLANCKVLVDFD